MATIAEYDAAITEAAQSPDKLPLALAKLREYVTDDLIALESLQQTIGTHESRIREQQAVITELYMRTGAKPETIEPPHTPTAEENEAALQAMLEGVTTLSE